MKTAKVLAWQTGEPGVLAVHQRARHSLARYLRHQTRNLASLDIAADLQRIGDCLESLPRLAQVFS